MNNFQMTKEQAIFFETLDDLYMEGSTEVIILAYNEFINNVKTSDTAIEIHEKAMSCLKKYKPMMWGEWKQLYQMRWDIIETLDLENAKWEYNDYKAEGLEIPK